MNESFLLDNFEGPLDFLLHLIQKNEIDIYEVSIHKITDQYLAKLKEYALSVDHGAEFIGTLATLLLLKSRMLLPRHDFTEEEDQNPHYTLIHQLIDYCRFKEAAKKLSLLEMQESDHYVRGVENIPIVHRPKGGLEGISLENLAGYFQEILKRKQPAVRNIKEEIYHVHEKKAWLKVLLKKESSILFYSLFSVEQCKEEWIVTFLAVLELMKMGEVKAVKEIESNEILLQGVYE